MTTLSLYEVDIDTPRPDPSNPMITRKGDAMRVAFTKYNDLLDYLYPAIEVISPTEPPEPKPYMKWLDTSGTTAVLKRRSKDNKTWTTIGSPFSDDVLLKANNLSDVPNKATARTNLGLGNSATRNVGTAANTVAAGNDSRITGAMQKAQNLNDVANKATARTNLGLGTAAELNATTSMLDSTTGRVLKVGDFGFGTASNTTVGTDDLLANTANGFYRSGASHTNAPINTTGAGFIKFGWSAAYKTFLYASPINDSVHFGNVENNVFKGWKKFAVDGGYGIGRSGADGTVNGPDAFPNDDLDATNVGGGLYYIPIGGQSATKLPSNITTKQGFVIHRQTGSGGGQIFLSFDGELVWRGRRSSAYSDWKKSLNVTDFGFGDTTILGSGRWRESNMDAPDIPSGMYYISSGIGLASGLPAGISSEGVVWHRQTGTGGAQIYVDFNGRMVIRGKRSSGYNEWFKPILPGDFGLGGGQANPPNFEAQPTGFYYKAGTRPSWAKGAFWLDMAYNTTAINSGLRLATDPYTDKFYLHGAVSGSKEYRPGCEIWHDRNTTVDSNGFIKKASPIISLANTHIEVSNHKEIDKAKFTRKGVGHYIIKNVPLLSRDGWYIETPRDRNGNVYFTIDYVENEDKQTLEIRTYEPDYSEGRVVNGSPVDILEGRYVSLRFTEDESLYPERMEQPEEDVVPVEEDHPPAEEVPTPVVEDIDFIDDTTTYPEPTEPIIVGDGPEEDPFNEEDLAS